MKLGRNLPKIWKPTLDFARYASDLAPKRPLGHRWESDSIHQLHDAAGNDDVGDCTCAGILKLDVAWSHNAGSWTTPDMRTAALGLYSRATGYDPNDPSTDKGADLQTILDYVKANGVYADGSGKIAGYVEVDASKPAEIVKAIDTFGGLYTGVSLADDWPGASKEGSVWDVAGDPDPQEGHCVAWFDYNEQGVIINSWGFFITVTWGAVAKYWAKSAGGEVYAVFSPDWIDAATKESPSGFNAAQLAADIAAV